MSAEERLVDVLEDEDDEEDEDGLPSYLSWRRQQRRKIQRKNRETINEFLQNALNFF